MIKGKTQDTHVRSFPDGKMETQSIGSLVLKSFFHFHRTLEESMVEITSTQLKGDAIQWYDLYETYHRVPSWGQFKRELVIRFRLSKYKNINGQFTKIC
ncbi:hypothetical protein BHE74_00044554 [Ensete ventricosum]|nr:hypothetical protein GW17_00023065 [Ensete ventricosum]RWW49321.1 hypothetical protein BHE74_00044554 [Ensete ventricosum]